MSNYIFLAFAPLQMYKSPMSEKERFTTNLDGEVLRRVRILAINTRCSTNKLIEEALRDLLKKYEKPATSTPRPIK